jgi:hypothetical protein
VGEGLGGESDDGDGRGGEETVHVQEMAGSRSRERLPELLT